MKVMSNSCPPPLPKKKMACGQIPTPAVPCKQTVQQHFLSLDIQHMTLAQLEPCSTSSTRGLATRAASCLWVSCFGELVRALTSFSIVGNIYLHSHQEGQQHYKNMHNVPRNSGDSSRMGNVFFFLMHTYPLTHTQMHLKPGRCTFALPS